jgi:hypothetical protein
VVWREGDPALLSDEDVRVRERAVESLVQAGGVRRAHALVAQAGDETLCCFVEHLEYESDLSLAARLLSDLAARGSHAVRLRVAEVATKLLRDDAMEPDTRARLEAIARV